MQRSAGSTRVSRSKAVLVVLLVAAVGVAGLLVGMQLEGGNADNPTEIDPMPATGAALATSTASMAEELPTETTEPPSTTATDPSVTLAPTTSLVPVTTADRAARDAAERASRREAEREEAARRAEEEARRAEVEARVRADYERKFEACSELAEEWSSAKSKMLTDAVMHATDYSSSDPQVLRAFYSRSLSNELGWARASGAILDSPDCRDVLTLDEHEQIKSDFEEAIASIEDTRQSCRLSFLTHVLSGASVPEFCK